MFAFLLLFVLGFFVAPIAIALHMRSRMKLAAHNLTLEISVLTRRLEALERLVGAREPAPVPVPEVPRELAPAPRPPVPKPEPVAPRVEPTTPAGAPTHVDPGPVATPATAVARAPTFDWESLVGTNWLNKAGVLALVIGLALFLGYSIRTMGPEGRVAVGWIASLSMLAGGVWLERRDTYRILGRGFIAGGWAAAYFTTYAMYALPAAQVIHSPLAGSLLLLAVAGLMVAHSLRYRSETLTALTYAIAFITLDLAPMRVFTLFASWPLAASLLWTSSRYSWQTLRLAGVVTTYSTLFIRMATSSGGTLDELWALQGLLAMHWLLFEGFDLLAFGSSRVLANSLLFPANAAGALTLSMLTWSGYPEAAFYLDAVAAGALGVSGVIRARLVRRDGAADDDVRAAGGMALPVALASLFFAAALHERFNGIALAIALSFEAELLLLSGLRTRTRLLQWLGLAAHTYGLAVAVGAIETSGRMMVALLGRTWHTWTAPVVGLAAMHYGNARLLIGWSAGAASAPLVAGSLLIALILGHEVRPLGACIVWMLVAFAMLEASRRTRFTELRIHAGVFAMGGLAADAALIETSQRYDWLALLLSSLVMSAIAYRVSTDDARVSRQERQLSTRVAAGVSVALAAASVWRLLPTEWVSLAWLAGGIALVASARALKRPHAQALGIGLMGLVGLRLLTVDLELDVMLGPVSVRLLSVAVSVAFFYAMSARASHPLVRHAFNLYASLLTTLLLLQELPLRFVTPGWALQGLALVGAGLFTRSALMRRTGLGLLALAAAKLLLYDARAFDTPARIVSFLLLGVALIAGSWLYTRFKTDAGS